MKHSTKKEFFEQKRKGLIQIVELMKNHENVILNIKKTKNLIRQFDHESKDSLNLVNPNQKMFSPKKNIGKMNLLSKDDSEKT